MMDPKRYAAIRRARLIRDNPGLKPHGKVSTYTHWGCRCDACRAATVARSRARDERLGWPQPTRQRVSTRGKLA